jgi:hypothetical protein
MKQMLSYIRRRRKEKLRKGEDEEVNYSVVTAKIQKKAL